MADNYYGWLGEKGYDGLVMVTDQGAAYVFNRPSNKFRRDDEFLKAKRDPGSEFEEITREEADALLKKFGGAPLDKQELDG